MLFLDVAGVRSAIGSWVGGGAPASGSTRSMAASIDRREATVDTLAAALATEPLLSLALLSTGIGIGLLVGSAVAFRAQRRLIREGERDD